jgi:hypothetical protein
MPHVHLDVGLVGCIDKPHCPVHKGFVFLDPIEDSLDLHPVPSSLLDGCFATSILSESERGALSQNSSSSIYPTNSETDTLLPTNFAGEPYFKTSEIA